MVAEKGKTKTTSPTEGSKALLDPEGTMEEGAFSLDQVRRNLKDREK